MSWVAAGIVMTMFVAADRPVTRKGEQVDSYFGVKVPDPYRWLEDDRSAETAEWVKMQNTYTGEYFGKLPYREAMVKRLREVTNYAKMNPPIQRGEWLYFSKNDGLQNQAVWYAQRGASGKPEVLIDPNQLSTDGTVALSGVSISKDGKYLAYMISRGGSDWREARVMDLETRKMLDDKLEWLKFTSCSWFGNGFFYSRYPAPEKGKELVNQMQFHRVYYHRVGTSQAQDELVYEDPKHPLRYHNLDANTAETYAGLSIFDASTGKKGNALLGLDLRLKERKFVPLAPDVTDDVYGFVDLIVGNVVVLSTKDAPKGKLVRWDAKAGRMAAAPLVAERADAIEGAWVAGNKLFVSYTKDVISRIDRFSLAGKLEGPIPMPGPGTASPSPDQSSSSGFHFVFTSLNTPPTIYHHDVKTNQNAIFFEPKLPGYSPSDYEVKQVFYPSKDGTKIPMFLMHRKGLKLDGKNPTLLYGYGGFAVNSLPYFDSLRLALLERGFVYASANLRGGAEYGEQWHEDGAKLKKQNVFDDCIAAAEWLIASGYTSKEKLAVNGVSNGGLLVGAVINQRPELFRAAVPQVGVMDMLRFQKFTAGAGWIGDYGSSDNEAEFSAQYRYSPMHNIREKGQYPAVLVTTADHDDRVVPAHSFKYAATLQERAATDHVALIRIGTQSGHGASSLGKSIEERADIYCFLLNELGVAF